LVSGGSPINFAALIEKSYNKSNYLLFVRSIARNEDPWHVNIGDMTWPPTLASVRSSHLESHASCSHFQLLTCFHKHNWRGHEIATVLICIFKSWHCTIRSCWQDKVVSSLYLNSHIENAIMTNMSVINADHFFCPDLRRWPQSDQVISSHTPRVHISSYWPHK
jgi:hypothetical protein